MTQVLLPLLALALLFPIAITAPGLLVVRRLRWSPVERLCAAVAVSLFLLYLAALAIYLAALDYGVYALVLCACVVTGVLLRADYVRLFRRSSARRILLFLLLMLTFATLCLSTIRHYSGGGWASDWALHYLKVQIFSHQHTPTTPQEVREMVIDRPSMQNLVAACFVRPLGGRFEVFQTVFCWLNTLAVLPCALMLNRFARRGARNVWVLAAVLICLPVVWGNVTYTWTKMLAAFYVVLGVWLYLRGMEKGDRGRIVAAFAALAVGVLAHYAALVYGVVVGGHYLLVVWWGRAGKWREMGAIVAVGVLVLATWFGWTTARYGLSEMATANNTLRHASEETPGEVVGKIARNFYWNVVPHPLRENKRAYVQENRAGYVRDWAFLLYQTNALFVTGSVSAVVLGWLVLCRLGRVDWRERVFWWGMIGGIPVLAAVALDVPNEEGAAHLFFHAWALMGAAAVAANVGALPKWGRWVLAGGVMVDFVLGVWLHHYVEHQVFRIIPGGIDTLGMAEQGVVNWAGKVQAGWMFVGDWCGAAARVLLGVMMVVGVGAAGWVGVRRRVNDQVPMTNK